jgi:hypothetical protein
MGRFVGFANCKNCSKVFRKKALSSRYCSDHCRDEFNARKSSNKKSNVEESVWTLVESGARSIDVIAERLNISVAAVARIVGPGSEDLQEWRENHICEKCGKRDFCTEDCSCDKCERERLWRITNEETMEKVRKRLEAKGIFRTEP